MTKPLENIKSCSIIGMGLLGSCHADELEGYRGLKVVAVCDLVPDKAAAWAGKHNAKCYSDYEKMLDDTHPDLVVIATQDPYHTDPLLSCCAHGVPYVICEKPLTTKLEDALKVQEAAKKSGTKIKVLFPNRLNPLGQSIHILTSEGYLGKPQYGEMRLDDNISVPINLWGADSGRFASISSPVFFLFSHAVDLLYYYYMPLKVKNVYAVGRVGTIGSQPDYMDAFITWADDSVTRLKTEWTKRIPDLVENYSQATYTSGGWIYNMTPGFRKQSGLLVFIDGPKKNAVAAKERLSREGFHADLIRIKDPIESYALELDPDAEGNHANWGDASKRYTDAFDVGEDPDLTPLTDLAGGIEQVRIVEALLCSWQEGKEITVL